jgi:hypothetical protein
MFALLRFSGGVPDAKIQSPSFLWPDSVPPLRYPAEIFGVKVLGVRDLTLSYDSTYPGGVPSLPAGVANVGGHMITFTLDHGCRITLRTSGTEKKVKFYIEAKTASSAPTEANPEEQRVQRESEAKVVARKVRTACVEYMTSILIPK